MRSIFCPVSSILTIKPALYLVRYIKRMYSSLVEHCPCDRTNQRSDSTWTMCLPILRPKYHFDLDLASHALGHSVVHTWQGYASRLSYILIEPLFRFFHHSMNLRSIQFGFSIIRIQSVDFLFDVGASCHQFSSPTQKRI
jgi:hypothetical protein